MCLSLRRAWAVLFAMGAADPKPGIGGGTSRKWYGFEQDTWRAIRVRCSVPPKSIHPRGLALRSLLVKQYPSVVSLKLLPTMSPTMPAPSSHETHSTRAAHHKM